MRWGTDRFAIILMIGLSLGTFASSCNRSGTLKGQTNANLTFYGKTIDQNGKALSGVKLVFRLEAYPRDWTFNTRGRDNDASMVTATSGADGRFQFLITACQLIRMKADHQGYRQLYDQDGGGAARTVDNKFYRQIAWGDLGYKIDSDHPAVYVYVKDGVHEVSALPCRGGYDSGGGKRWTLNKPAWPHKPSLTDVHYLPPSSRPTTREK